MHATWLRKGPPKGRACNARGGRLWSLPDRTVACPNGHDPRGAALAVTSLVDRRLQQQGDGKEGVAG
eukprot:4195203-Lingulodinium_polyedra.AAC.1